VGDAAITGAGNLGVRWVIHAAAMGDEPVSERSIRSSTAASVRLAAQHRACRIAFPILGSGIGGFDFRRAAEVMLEAIRAAPEAERLEEIVFYGFSANDVGILRELIPA
jgi:O-acetyl-ADP-ribose deacetylase (regulator of RNase III)